jgi:hypothetical protein
MDQIPADARRICRRFWSVTAIVPAMKGVTNGHAPTLDEAKAKFRAAWEKASGASQPTANHPLLVCALSVL